MGFLNRIFGSSVAGAVPPVSSAPRADVSAAYTVYSLDDPALLEFMRMGSESVTGKGVSVKSALRNPSMFRAVSLISNSIGMLPMHLIDESTKQKAKDNPLYDVLHRRPNGFQSAFDFRALMQLRVLVKGDAYAHIVRTTSLKTGLPSVARLLPLDSERVTPILNADWTVTYRYEPSVGGRKLLRSDEVFHLRGMSLDGLKGMSLVEQARDAIAIAIAAEMAMGRMFKNGTLVGGALTHQGKLSDPAFERLKESLAEKEGAENAGKNLILEEGMKFEAYGHNAKDSQMAEMRKLQIEEIARVTGVPRPLLMVDETSWGSGIEALGQFFVAYALNPWFEAWQQAVERSLLNEAEQKTLAVKFNPGALLRGSLKDQADFLAKALGSGGHAPWMHVEEVRDVMDLPKREAPPHPMAGQRSAPVVEPEPEEKPAKAKTPVKDNDDDE